MYNTVLFGFPSEKGVSVEQDMNNRLTSYVGNLEPAQHLPDTILTDYLEQDNMKTLIAKILNGDSEIDETIKKREKIYESIFKNKLTSTNQLIAESYKSSIDTLKSVVINFKSTFEDNSKTPQEKVKALINLGDGLPKYALVNLGNEILKNRDSILQNVREENPLLLEGIYQQKLVSVEDDVMNCHTNFTKNMMLMIEGQMTGGVPFKEGVEKINAYYQSILRWYGSPVPRTPEKLSDQHIAYFNNIRDEFISTSSESRINYSEDSRLSDDEKKQITLRLKQYGINAVLHGHNDEDGKVKGTDDVPILSIDRGAYKGSEGVSNRPTSTASINTSGVLSYF